MIVECPISLGELVDKITILRIKMEKISDEGKVQAVINEEKVISARLHDLALSGIDWYIDQLLDVNRKLWDVEDEIRKLESSNDFGEIFIDLARKVYMTNDERFLIKNEINKKYESGIVEVKSY